MKDNNDDYIEDSRLKTVLEQKFFEMNQDQELAPADLKQEVFSTLNSLIMVGDLVDLFTVKFAQTELTFLDPSIEEDWDNSEESKEPEN